MYNKKSKIIDNLAKKIGVIFKKETYDYIQ